MSQADLGATVAVGCVGASLLELVIGMFLALDLYSWGTSEVSPFWQAPFCEKRFQT